MKDEVNKQDNENSDDVTIDIDSDIDDSVVAEESQSATIKKLREKLSQVTEEKQKYLTDLQKAKADFINLRKRDEEEKESIIRFANEQLLAEFISTLDSIELAQKDAKIWESLPVDWRKGIESIFTQLKNTLKKAGLEEIEANGEVFDPRLHEAIQTVKTGDKKQDHIVASVFQTGYKLFGKVLRPAKVTIWSHGE